MKKLQAAVVPLHYEALIMPARYYLTLDEVTKQEWAGYRSRGKFTRRPKTFN